MLSAIEISYDSVNSIGLKLNTTVWVQIQYTKTEIERNVLLLVQYLVDHLITDTTEKWGRGFKVRLTFLCKEWNVYRY